MLLNYIKFSGIMGVFCSILLAEGGGARAAKAAKEARYRIAPDEHFGSESTESHPVERALPIKGRAAKYLVQDDEAAPAPVEPSDAARNHHLKPIDDSELQIKRLLLDAKAAVPGSEEEADNLVAASGLMHNSRHTRKAANILWKAAEIYYELKYDDKAARAFSKSAFYFAKTGDVSEAPKGYENAGKIYQATEKHQEAAEVFQKAAIIYEAQGKYKEALGTLQLASECYVNAKQYKDATDMKWIVAEIYERARSYRKAAVTMKEVASMHRTFTKDTRRASEALVKAGYYFESGLAFDKAERSFKEAQIIYQSLKLDSLVLQAGELQASMHEKYQQLQVAESAKLKAKENLLKFSSDLNKMSSKDREENQKLYFEAAQNYSRVRMYKDSAIAFRNAGGVATATAHRIRFFQFAESMYGKARMNTEKLHMMDLIAKLHTPKEQQPLQVLEPLI